MGSELLHSGFRSVIRTMFLFTVATILLAGLTTCSQAPEETQSTAPEPASNIELPDNYQRSSSPWLTHDEARLRSQSVSNVEYRLALDLTDEKTYSGSVVITFDYKTSKFPLTLDFLGSKVKSIKVGSELVPASDTKGHISISSRYFSEGRNSIEINYLNEYSADGWGLYRFVDRVDGRVYLYTHFEPYAANYMVPSFDQPNLRARWTVNVRVPDDWQVVTSVREDRIVRADGVATWEFPVSAEISSYIFPLHAGQYHIWESSAGNIPLRLFARESLAEYVRADWWLDITAKGMAYYQEYFDEPYPFTKYDQLIVPDFNIGGMENIAAVTYTEGYIPRGEPTQARLQRIASTILHELSHMWFGDLVTIDWWNALWLKESFASLMDPMAIDKATDFDEAWLAFYLADKQKAYAADQRVTTHPIEMPVTDTKSGDASFDEITYQKGASVLKQLKHFLGEDTFRDGMRTYFDRYAWTAAKLPDFMDTLSEVSGRDLKGWTRDWLETPGANTVEAQYECGAGKITSFNLRQTAPEDYPTLRSHKLQIGIYQKAEGKIEIQRVTAVELNGENTKVGEFTGEPCPLLVYPNVSDWGYIKVRFDQVTLRNIPENLNNVHDPLLRSMLWFALWDAVLDINLPLSDFLDIALAQLPGETNSAVLETLVKKLVIAKKYLYLFGDDAAELRENYLPTLEKMSYAGILGSETGSDVQKQWFDAWLGLASTDQGAADIEKWLLGEIEPKSLTDDQDRRWVALTTLSGMGYQGTPQLREAELTRDGSDSGAEAALKVQSARPDLELKTSFLDSVDDTTGDTNSAQAKAMIVKMFPASQTHLHEQLAERILKSLPILDVERDQDFIEDYVDYILPKLCTAESIDRLANSINDRGELGLIATKALLDTHQADEGCVAMAAKQLGRF